jgi:hypothetical protein
MAASPGQELSPAKKAAILYVTCNIMIRNSDCPPRGLFEQRGNPAFGAAMIFNSLGQADV